MIHILVRLFRELERLIDNKTCLRPVERFEESIVVRKQIRTLFGSFLFEALVVAEVYLGAVHAHDPEANRILVHIAFNLHHQPSNIHTHIRQLNTSSECIFSRLNDSLILETRIP